MAIFVSVRSAREYHPDDLGDMLHRLIHQPLTRKRLKKDFPEVVRRYKTPVAAAASVKRMQATMQKDPRFEMLIVVLGTNEDDQDVYGVVTLQPAEVPGEEGVQPGLMVAAWLSAYRPADLRNIMPTLVGQIITHIRDNIAYNDAVRLWTLVRPRHQIATSLITRRWGKLEFQASGRPKFYPSVDGVWWLRQLYVSRPLKFIR